MDQRGHSGNSVKLQDCCHTHVPEPELLIQQMWWNKLRRLKCVSSCWLPPITPLWKPLWSIVSWWYHSRSAVDKMALQRDIKSLLRVINNQLPSLGHTRYLFFTQDHKNHVGLTTSWPPPLCPALWTTLQVCPMTFLWSQNCPILAA